MGISGRCMGTKKERMRVVDGYGYGGCILYTYMKIE
jgi:hypothetical protein